MALLTYLFAFAHFSSEILIFRTARISLPVLSPVIVASTYLFFVRISRDPYPLLSHSPHFYSYLTCLDDLAIRLLRKSMTPRFRRLVLFKVAIQPCHFDVENRPEATVGVHPSLAGAITPSIMRRPRHDPSSWRKHCSFRYG
jgi:hypothetical protein